MYGYAGTMLRVNLSTGAVDKQPLDEARVEMRPADAYWGQGALSVEKQLKADLGDDFQIVAIGPAGERRVRYACLSHDFGRQAGRSGLGAVLGAKRIKAIAVRGTGRLPVYDLKNALFGGNCALQTIEEVAYANYLCDELGLDTISAGAVISWTIECFEKGILDEADRLVEEGVSLN
jgi:aldehyde:ferredoxin oxidoreductase